MVNTFDTGKMDDVRLIGIVRKLFDLTPRGIIDRLKLLRPIYKSTAAYGHFGWERDECTWEYRDYVDALRSNR